MIVYALNLADMACTLYAVKNGARELNPLLQSIPALVMYKVVIVGGLCWWLSTRPERIARLGLRLCAAVYAVLLLYHGAGILSIS